MTQRQMPRPPRTVESAGGHHIRQNDAERRGRSSRWMNDWRIEYSRTQTVGDDELYRHISSWRILADHLLASFNALVQNKSYTLGELNNGQFLGHFVGVTLSAYKRKVRSSDLPRSSNTSLVRRTPFANDSCNDRFWTTQNHGSGISAASHNFRNFCSRERLIIHRFNSFFCFRSNTSL